MCKIQVRFKQSADIRGVFGYALNVEVISAEEISSKIFVYHQSSPGVDGNSISEFSHVASPVDLQDVPEDAASETIPWYRTSNVTVWVRSIDDLTMSKQLFVEDISSLQRSFDALSSVSDFVNQTTLEFKNGDIQNV